MFHYHMEQLHFNTGVLCPSHNSLSLFNHSGYTLMIKEHTLCWDKKNIQYCIRDSNHLKKKTKNTELGLFYLQFRKTPILIW